MNISKAVRLLKPGKIAVVKSTALDNLFYHTFITPDIAVGPMTPELLLADWVVVPEHFLSAGSLLIKVHRRRHPLLRIPKKEYGLPRSAMTFLRLCPEIADCVAVATRGEEIVGFSRFYIDKNTYYDAGTWVDKSHRRLGVATKMIEKATANAQKVIFTAISPSGHKLAKAFKKTLKTRNPGKPKIIVKNRS